MSGSRDKVTWVRRWYSLHKNGVLFTFDGPVSTCLSAGILLCLYCQCHRLLTKTKSKDRNDVSFSYKPAVLQKKKQKHSSKTQTIQSDTIGSAK
jgi:hypothetical protein